MVFYQENGRSLLLRAYEKGFVHDDEHMCSMTKRRTEGIQTWADEQTMREIYFAFEKPIKDGIQEERWLLIIVLARPDRKTCLDDRSTVNGDRGNDYH